MNDDLDKIINELEVEDPKQKRIDMLEYIREAIKVHFNPRDPKSIIDLQKAIKLCQEYLDADLNIKNRFLKGDYDPIRYQVILTDFEKKIFVKFRSFLGGILILDHEWADEQTEYAMNYLIEFFKAKGLIFDERDFSIEINSKHIPKFINMVKRLRDWAIKHREDGDKITVEIKIKKYYDAD